MDSKPFDQHEAEKNLAAREKIARESREQMRLDMLKKCDEYLKQRFSSEKTEVYLIGSITRPYSFHENSDIDIVLKNYSGDRFEIWTELEASLHRRVEVIIFESCHFQEHIIQQGMKVV